MSDSSSPAPDGVDGRRTKAQERTERQRDRILQAAKACFVEHGFHAASMANISEAAQMSPGLIYRYFENKNAIILAIIERQLHDSRAGIEALNHGSNLGARLAEVFAKLQVADEEFMNPALYLEMSAQASRDPQIAQALGESDQAMRGELSAWLSKASGVEDQPADMLDVEPRALVLQCLFEGLVVRAVREPRLDDGARPAGLDPPAAEAQRLAMQRRRQLKTDCGTPDAKARAAEF